jgi:hypothetical protein
MFNFEKIKLKIEEGTLTRSQIQGILDQASFLELTSNQISYLQNSMHKIEQRIYLVDERGNVEIKTITRSQGVVNESPKADFGRLGHDSESMKLAISKFLDKPQNELPELEWEFDSFNLQKDYYSIADSYAKILKYFYRNDFEKPIKVVFHSFSRCSIFFSNNEISQAEIFEHKISFIHKIQEKKHFFCSRCDTHFEVSLISKSVEKMCPCCGKKIQKSFESVDFYFDED